MRETDLTIHLDDILSELGKVRNEIYFKFEVVEGVMRTKNIMGVGIGCLAL